MPSVVTGVVTPSAPLGSANMGAAAVATAGATAVTTVDDGIGAIIGVADAVGMFIFDIIIKFWN